MLVRVKEMKYMKNPLKSLYHNRRLKRLTTIFIIIAATVAISSLANIIVSIAFGIFSSIILYLEMNRLYFFVNKKKLDAETKALANNFERMQSCIANLENIGNSSNEIIEAINVMNNIAIQVNQLPSYTPAEAKTIRGHAENIATLANEMCVIAVGSAKVAKDTADQFFESAARVNVVAEISNQTAEALQNIKAIISKVAHLIVKITQISHEQHSITNESNTVNIEMLQANADAINQELSAQLKQLSMLVDNIKLNRGG